MEKISVIVAVYNIENYIETCLKSLEEQTIENYEVLIINDGSTDNSEKKIKKFLKNKKFIYLKKENGGLSSARNYGLAYAKGKYITFVDGDDYVEKNYLEALYKTCKEQNVDISICAFERNYQDKTVLNSITKKDVELFRFPAAWNKMIKKSLIEKYKLQFPEGLWYEDLSFTTKALLLENYAITNQYLYHYRQNETSIMHTYDDRIFNIYKIIEGIEDFTKQHQVEEEKKKNLEFINIYHILVGTIYRASFHKNFSISMIKEIYNYVKEKYPKWYQNPFIKDLPFFYKTYLQFLRGHLFIIVYLFLKIGNTKVEM